MRTIKNLNPFNKLIPFSLSIDISILWKLSRVFLLCTADGIYGSSSVERPEARPETQNAENGR